MKFCNRRNSSNPATLVSFLVHELRQGEKNIWGPSLGKVSEYHLTCMSVKRQWVAMFVSWRSQISVRKRKDPITCNLFIDVSQHVDRVLLYISADTRLLCWLLVSVDTPSTDALSTRYRLLLTTYPVRKFGAWQSLKTALFGTDYHS